MEEPGINYEVRELIATLTISSPARLNAMTFDMWLALQRRIKAAERDGEVRVIAIRGEGSKAFGSGADISQFERVRTGGDAIEAYNAAVQQANRSIAEAAKPTVAL